VWRRSGKTVSGGNVNLSHNSYSCTPTGKQRSSHRLCLPSNNQKSKFPVYKEEKKKMARIFCISPLFFSAQKLSWSFLPLPVLIIERYNTAEFSHKSGGGVFVADWIVRVQVLWAFFSSPVIPRDWRGRERMFHTKPFTPPAHPKNNVSLNFLLDVIPGGSSIEFGGH